MSRSLGATYLGARTTGFRVWAPRARSAAVRIVSPHDCLIEMEPRPGGYFEVLAEGLEPGARYFYELEGGPKRPGGRRRPDPASRFQPEGVHGPSEVIDGAFPWQQEHWRGLLLEDLIFYELHVGTFTAEGTFEAAIAELPRLAELGVNAIELMPVAQFPGERNWGYDGVYPFAAQNSYGGPEGLRRLVDACHGHGLAVALDVVYNHLGPEGNYLAEFGPYFTDRYHTPWGKAINFDGPESDEVRRYFIENALAWLTEFRIDVLRLDAVHAIFDQSPRPFLQELATRFHERAARLGRRAYLVPESPSNDPRLLRPPGLGGYGLDAQWNDDFHHALRALLTGDRSGYYQDYGEFRHLVRAFRDGYVYTGEYSAYRRRRHGSPAEGIEGKQFVVFSQNHDQVGNRRAGDRLSASLCGSRQRLAAGAVILSPFLPLLFMGEEYGETAPFQYFVSHSDAELIEAVRQGRAEEFSAFDWQGSIPDPQDEATFLRSKLGGERRGPAFEFYRRLIALRRSVPALSLPDLRHAEVTGYEEEKLLLLRRWDDEGGEILVAYNFSDAERQAPAAWAEARRIFDSSPEPVPGPGLNPYSFAVFERGR